MLNWPRTSDNQATHRKSAVLNQTFATTELTLLMHKGKDTRRGLFSPRKKGFRST